MFKQTSLHHPINKANAVIAEKAGWQVAERFGNVEEETAAARTAVALIDLSANGKIRIEGQQAANFLDAADLVINAGRHTDDGNLYRLRQDLLFLHTRPDTVEALTQTLQAKATTVADLITVTNVTHGNAELWLVGPQSASLLSRLCGLDFHGSRFPNYTAKQSSVAKTTQLIIHQDVGRLPAYALVGGRSLGAYLWQTILEAGQNLDIQPIGIAAWNQLTASQE